MENERPASLLPVFASAIAGALLAVAAAPIVVPAVEASLFAVEPKGWWYLSRSTGLVAFALLAASTLLGLLLSGKVAKRWPGAASAAALHEHTALVGLGFAAVHAAVLLGDRHASLDWMGVLALVLTAMLVGSFYVRRRIGPRVWRALHFAAFAAFALALVHSVTTGTDHGWVDLLYVIPGALVVFLGVHRLLIEWGIGQRTSRSVG